MKNIRIIWPEVKWVSAAQIKQWHDDAISNGEDIELGLENTIDQAKALENIGFITMGSQRLPQ